MSKSIAEITDQIQKFRLKRGWANDILTQLIASILVELGELSEHYQWKQEFEKLSEEKKQEVGFEFVDVIFYLFTLAYKSGIDIEKYFDLKLPLLAKKFPISASESDHAKAHHAYRKSGKNKLYA